MRQLLPVFAIIILFSVCNGCGSSDLVPARGVVMFNGAPEPKANVTFVRVEGEGPAAHAVTRDDGAFELWTGSDAGARPGKYKVLVRKDTSADFQIPDHLMPGQYLQQKGLIPRPVLPAVYTYINETPLTAEVVGDGHQNDFQLQLNGQRPK